MMLKRGKGEKPNTTFLRRTKLLMYYGAKMMSNRKKFIRLILVSVLCIVLSGYVCYCIGESKGSSDVFEAKKISPSGNYTLEKAYGYDEARYVRFCVVPNSVKDTQAYVSEDVFYVRFTTIIEWGLDDTVWVYSGDVGTYYWIVEDKQWVKKQADNDSISLAPANIREKWASIA